MCSTGKDAADAALSTPAFLGDADDRSQVPQTHHISALSIMDHWFLSRQLLGIMSNAEPDTTLPNLPRESLNFTLFENNYISHF